MIKGKIHAEYLDKETPLRILEVIEFFTPEKGGAVESVRLLSRHLSRLGHKVTVCTSDFRWSPELVRDGSFEVIPFRTLLQFSNLYITPSLIPWLKSQLKEFDVVHLNDYRSFQNAVAAYYAHKYDIPYVLSARGCLPKHWGRKHIKMLYDIAFGRKILENAAQLHALSNLERAQYEALGVSPSKVKLIPNAIDLSLFENLSNKDDFKQHFGINKEEKVILYLGRLHQIKRVDLLIRSFNLLSLQMSGVKLVIVGPDDGHLSSLRGLAKALNMEERVLFTGPLFHQDKVAAYMGADLVVAPSAYEIFNRTILEAWCCGAPVIAVGQHGVLDWVDEEVALVVEADEAKLSTAMSNLLTNKAERQHRIEAGRRVVAEKFNIEKIAVQFEELFCNILR